MKATASGDSTFVLNDGVAQSALETLPLGLAILCGGNVIWSNQACARLFGADTAAEMWGQKLSTLTRVSPVRQKTNTHGVRSSIVRKVHRLDGTCIRIEVHSYPFLAAGQDFQLLSGSRFCQGIMATREDAEKELQRNERWHRALVEYSSDGIALLDLQHKIGYFNNPEMLGYSRREVTGHDFFNLIHDGDREKVQVAWRRCSARLREVVTFEYRMQHKDGSWREMECVAVNHLGTSPLHAIVATFRDVSDRKRMQEHLRHSQKIEAVGRLVGGVAHDFNNLLTAIRLYTDLLLSKLGSDHPVSPHAEEIRQASEKGATLIHQLLAFRGQQVLEPKVLCLNSVIAESQNMLSRLLGEQIKAVFVLAPKLGNVQVDPAQIHEVILNLALNARDAMPAGGRLTIRTSEIKLDELQASKYAPPLLPGRYVMVEVNDTGCGMNAKTQAHLFQPYFTTKPPEKGHGLGLATAYGFITQSGGTIVVRSKVDEGTSVRVYLPCVTKRPERTQHKRAAPALRPSSETVLLVEDEPAVRRSMESILRGGGYQVLAAGDGSTALAEARQHRSPIHAAVVDMVMPGLSGRETAQQLRELCPAIRVLYVSGYDPKNQLEDGAWLLPKPFSADALLHRLGELLDRETKGRARAGISRKFARYGPEL